MTQDELLANMRWDTTLRVSFPVPYAEQKVDVFLDPLLPRLCFLAEKATDRKTKVRVVLSIRVIPRRIRLPH